MVESLTAYEIFCGKVLRDLENLVRGCSRSLKMSPFDRPSKTFYWFVFFIVIVALSGTVFELFDVD